MSDYWPYILAEVEDNKEETLANHVSPLNVERLRRTAARAEALYRVMPYAAYDAL